MAQAKKNTAIDYFIEQTEGYIIQMVDQEQATLDEVEAALKEMIASIKHRSEVEKFKDMITEATTLFTLTIRNQAIANELKEFAKSQGIDTSVHIDTRKRTYDYSITFLIGNIPFDGRRK